MARWFPSISTSAESSSYLASIFRALDQDDARYGIVRNAEPVRGLFTQGMVIKDGAKCRKHGNVVSPDDMVASSARFRRMYSLVRRAPDCDLMAGEGVSGVNAF